MSPRAFLSRRALLATAAVGSMAGALYKFTNREAAFATMTGFIAYTPDSFFRSRVDGGGGGRPLAPIDAARTTGFHNFMASFPDQRNFSAPTIKGLGTNKWGTAYAVGQATDPIWKLTGTVPTAVAFLKTAGFHAPDSFGKQITGTSDSPFVVQDMAKGWSIWAAKASVTGTHTINVGAAGAFQHASNGLDKRNSRCTPGVFNFRSRGAIPDAMVIRRDLVDQAIANGTGLGHVLHMFMTETNSKDGFCNPMVGCESQSGWGAEGERIFIRPEIDLSKRGLSPFGLAIARTLQQNGCYLGDNAGAESTLKAEQTSSAHNPWAGLTVSDKALLGKVTWNDFAVAQRGWQ